MPVVTIRALRAVASFCGETTLSSFTEPARFRQASRAASTAPRRRLARRYRYLHFPRHDYGALQTTVTLPYGLLRHPTLPPQTPLMLAMLEISQTTGCVSSFCRTPAALARSTLNPIRTAYILCRTRGDLGY
ncbi:hypothetical protein MSAN_02301400 [Mycena sanguinolenta]|uniref:Uncharacterized protein n=1 Tax=Mycena sanguinolenta TaxID=230812 RepID=A0A8H6X9C5_9AGAR|nr:hypothetical protein MSAN_02301400 [Mycena sanguinolenta]